jgi:hypothetical protein
MAFLAMTATLLVAPLLTDRRSRLNPAAHMMNSGELPLPVMASRAVRVLHDELALPVAGTPHRGAGAPAMLAASLPYTNRS